jgi:hypothetical protein
VDHYSGVTKFEFFHIRIPPLFMFMWGIEIDCGHSVDIQNAHPLVVFLPSLSNNRIQRRVVAVTIACILAWLPLRIVAHSRSSALYAAVERKTVSFPVGSETYLFSSLLS